MRNTLLMFGSLTLTSFVVGNAYIQKHQFYPSVIYVTKSNTSMAVIYLQIGIMVLMLSKLIRNVFFGELRAAEVEHLMDRFWYAITETCLAFTVFKDEFSPKFAALFGILLFLKSFHWLAEDRVDYMERSPTISWLFHLRIVFLMTILGMLNLFFILYAYYHTVTKGASVQLVFGFEYAILLVVIVNTGIKYLLHTIDIHRDVFWENKAVFLLHVEVVIGFLKVILYFTFVAIMIKLYTLPLFAFRPMYYSMRNFKKALYDVIQSRRAIRNMNTLYQDATAEELQAADNVCIICREEMQAGAKKLPCNHIFHVSCLRSWFQRHQTCPTCRLNVLRTTPENRTPNAAAAAAAGAQANPFVGPAFPPWHPNFFQQFHLPRFPEAQQPQTPPSTPQTSTSQAPPPNAPMFGFGNIPAPNQQGSSSNQNQFTPPTSTQFPFMWPPVLLIPPITTPPPMPPRDWQGLSLEELRQMETNTRSAVEARLKTLNDINTLLDAAQLLMRQYVAAEATASMRVAAGAAASAASAPPTAAASSTADAPSTTTANAATSSTSRGSATVGSGVIRGEPSTSQVTTSSVSPLAQTSSTQSVEKNNDGASNSDLTRDVDPVQNAQ